MGSGPTPPPDRMGPGAPRAPQMGWGDDDDGEGEDDDDVEHDDKDDDGGGGDDEYDLRPKSSQTRSRTPP